MTFQIGLTLFYNTGSGYKTAKEEGGRGKLCLQKGNLQPCEDEKFCEVGHLCNFKHLNWNI